MSLISRKSSLKDSQGNTDVLKVEPETPTAGGVAAIAGGSQITRIPPKLCRVFKDP